MKNNKTGNHLLQDTIVSVIVVSNNDQEIIEERLKAIHQTLSSLKSNYEILVVDNNSEDDTVLNVRKLHKKLTYIRVVVLSKQYDNDIAYTAGLDNCIGDYAILFNIYTDPPEILLDLVEKLLQGYDVVLGNYTKSISSLGMISNAFLALAERLSTHGFHYRKSYLTGLSRRAINSIIRTRRKSRNLSYINSLIGYKRATITYKPLQSFLHKLKKESFFELFFHATDIIISNSFRPIRLLSFLGMLASILFLLYIFIIVILEVFFGKHIAPQGWISIATVMGTMFLLLFSLLTIIAEYIIRILNESRNEPFYFISDDIDKSVILMREDSINIV